MKKTAIENIIFSTIENNKMLENSVANIETLKGVQFKDPRNKKELLKLLDSDYTCIIKLIEVTRELADLSFHESLHNNMKGK